MAKLKSKAGASIPNRHVHSRVSYLYQAALYLRNAPGDKVQASRERDHSCSSEVDRGLEESIAEESLKQSRYLLSHLRGVSRKAQTRVHPDIKHMICKRCDAILLPGQTSKCFIENSSSAGRKPWADVLVYQCNACQATKRFPVGQTSLKKKADIKPSVKR